LIRSIAFLYLGCAAAPLLAQNPDVQIPAPLPAPHTPIITDTEFKEAIPSLDDAPLESIEAWDAAQESREDVGTAQQQAAQLRERSCKTSQSPTSLRWPSKPARTPQTPAIRKKTLKGSEPN
jgi:hypothetical protein